MCRSKFFQISNKHMNHGHCSLVCDPQTGNVYIVLDRDFSKILKLSIKDGCIETFKGYETNSRHSLPDGPEGIGTAELKAHFN